MKRKTSRKNYAQQFKAPARIARKPKKAAVKTESAPASAYYSDKWNVSLTV